MGLYRNDKPHAVYIAGYLIQPGEAREVPDSLISLDQELAALPEALNTDQTGQPTEAIESNQGEVPPIASNAGDGGAILPTNVTALDKEIQPPPSDPPPSGTGKKK